MNKIRNRDMNYDEFISNGEQVLRWAANYFEGLESLPVMSQIKPGDVKDKIPNSPPLDGESFDEIISDLDKIITPGITHWAHPNFMAYFNSSGSAPGILAELIAATYNVNGMVWMSSPAVAELEEKVLAWFRDSLRISKEFWGVVYDTASVSSMHAIAAARENIPGLEIREKGMTGRKDLPKLKLYCSTQAHSSIDKACLTLGIGMDGISHIPVNDRFEMIPEELEKQIKIDIKNGELPFCVVSTIGTTATTSVDPVKQISAISKKYDIWHHVDAAHAGVTAILDEYKNLFDGSESADSIVINPHKWFFVPIDFSALYIKNRSILKRAFSLVPEYLKTEGGDEITNLMDYGVPLGRRLRAIKLWFVFRYFGLEGLKLIISNHIASAKWFEEKVKTHPKTKLFAPVTFSTVCFRYFPNNTYEETLNQFNKNLVDRINKSGKLFLTGTKINDLYFIRVVVSGIRTEKRHVESAWELLLSEAQKLENEFEC
ncbi:MAG: amino acid decarboxylase [Melioribacteraceae bacterium]|nr:amino acid decarboxylase [Melioribacteraceae bacterium]MCF8265285.1 amino acid decarboxylase [Melioribacteraceae bacterium]MCF8412614.1 amino acid decarboxylase [Melioribacteraceae bacterium]MCF8431516.1 amino acid decarboxylase [Melioribacteraceae bacterium]